MIYDPNQDQNRIDDEKKDDGYKRENEKNSCLMHEMIKCNTEDGKKIDFEMLFLFSSSIDRQPAN